MVNCPRSWQEMRNQCHSIDDRLVIMKLYTKNDNFLVYYEYRENHIKLLIHAKQKQVLKYSFLAFVVSKEGLAGTSPTKRLLDMSSIGCPSIS